MKPVLVIGNTTCDVVIEVSSLPTSQQDGLINNQRFEVGGCAFNVVNALSLLRVPYHFISPIGQGVYGAFLQKECAQRNIEMPLQIEEEHGCCYCFVEADRDRTFLSYQGGEYRFEEAWLTPFLKMEFSYIYVCGLDIEDEKGARLVHALSKLRGQVVFAPGSRLSHISEERMKAMLSLRPILHLNEEEAKLLAARDNCEDAARALYAISERAVVITRGKEGTYCFDGCAHTRKAASVSIVVNTLGAGDAHAGGFIASLAQGFTIEQALQMAHTMAAAVIQVPGASCTKGEWECTIRE